MNDLVGGLLYLIAGILDPQPRNPALSIDFEISTGASYQQNPPEEFSIPTAVFIPPATLTVVNQKHPYYSEPSGDTRYLDLRVKESGEHRWLRTKAEIRFLHDYRRNADALGQRQGLQPFHYSKLSWHSPSGGHDRNFFSLESMSIWSRPFDSLSFELGRQPINWSTNFYFSPCDVFSPWSPADFQRFHRSGVDALRLTWEPAPMVNAEYVAAFGYVARAFDAERLNVTEEEIHSPFHAAGAQYLRFRSDFGGLAFSTQIGHGNFRKFGGGTLEADLGRGISLAFEAAQSYHDDDPGTAWHEATAGLTAQLNENWTLRSEIATAPSFPVDPILMLNPRREQRSLGALGLDWQAAALLKLGVLGLSDLERSEGLAALSASLSLSDGADLICSFQSPWRIPGHQFHTTTAFELAPLSAGLQIRWVI